MFNFSGINILKRHGNYFREDRMSQNILKLWLRFFWKSQFERAYWTSSYKKKVEKDLYLWSCFFSKNELYKHLESVHSNSKSLNCPVCDLSFSRIDILERHANHFYEDSMSHNMIKLWLWFFWKSQFGRSYWISTYKKKLKKISICDHAFSQKSQL